jgi:hypothetical protein
MTTTLALLTLLAAGRFDDGLQLGYSAVQGRDRSGYRAVFGARDGRPSVAFHSPGGVSVAPAEGRSPLAMGFDGLPEQVQGLPLWLPHAFRRLGTVVYDDGEGFKHNRGKLAYVLTSAERWKGFDAVVLSYRHQGMQEEDNWSLEARYDAASGFLLSAFIEVRLGRDPHTTFKLVLATSTDGEMKRKLS